MGMFDDIRCRMPMPMPADLGELTSVVWPDVNFQTKDFHCVLDLFEIREDGSLWHEEVEYEPIPEEEREKGLFSPVIRRKSSKWVKHVYTGYVNFYTIFHRDVHDYWVEWRAHVIDGTVNELILDTWKLEDNHERKELEERLASERRVRLKFEKTLRYRTLYRPWNATVRFVFNIINGVTNVWSEWRIKLERKLKI